MIQHNSVESDGYMVNSDLDQVQLAVRTRGQVGPAPTQTGAGPPSLSH